MIKLGNFQGMMPKIDDVYLPEGAATYVKNARLRSGALVPFRQETVSKTLTATKATILVVDGAVEGFPAGTSIVQGFNITSRRYISGDGVPRIEGTGFSYPLALAAPTTRPTVNITAGTPDPDTSVNVVFAYTWVTTLDEESAPSAVSAGRNYSDGVTITLTDFAAAPTGRAIDRKRIYRSVTDITGSTELFFVAEIPAVQTSFAYTGEAYPIQEPIPSTDYDTPVADIEGFTTMPNGIIAGFKGRDLYFCEPYIPHAWPQKYSLRTDVQIVALVSFGSSLAVLTKGQPYMVSGIHPENMAMEKVEENLPCVSADGVVDLGYAAAYPSNDGLVVVSSSGPKLISRNMFTRDNWKAMNPKQMVAAQFEGRYAFIHETESDGRRLGFIDLTGEQPYYLPCDTEGLDLAYDIGSGELFILKADQRTIHLFDSPTGANKTAVWKSKPFESGRLVNYGAARFNTDQRPPPVGSVSTMKIYADDVLVDTLTIPNVIDRLASGFLADRYQVEITTDATITTVILAEGIAQVMEA